MHLVYWKFPQKWSFPPLGALKLSICHFIVQSVLVLASLDFFAVLESIYVVIMQVMYIVVNFQALISIYENFPEKMCLFVCRRSP